MEMSKNSPTNSLSQEANTNQQTPLSNQNEIPKLTNTNRPGIIVIAIAVIVILIVLGLVGYFVLNKSTARNPYKIQDKQTITQPTQIPNSESSKFVYFHRVLATPPQNTTTYAGRTFKDQFVLFDVATKEKKVFYQETPVDDEVDSYRLFDNKNITITSPRGNRVISLDGQGVSTPPDNYFSDTYSPSKNVSVQYQFKDNDVIFSVANTQTGLRKSIEMKQNLLLVPSIVGWSNDENSIFFTLGQTHITDPTHSLYQLDIGVGEVKKFPRDSVTNVTESNYSTWINSKRDEIYFKGKNGLFKQAIAEIKAAPIQFQNIHLVSGGNLVFPDDANSEAFALSDDQGLWIKDLSSSKEDLIFQKKNDGSVSPISWKGENLIFTFYREGYNSEENNKNYGQYIIGYIYNTKTKEMTEFANNKSDSLFTLGRVYYIDWLK